MSVSILTLPCPIRPAPAALLAGLVALSGTALGAELDDHPAVARYPGAKIAHSDYKEFEEAQLVLSKPYSSGGRLVADKVLPVEGQVTYLQYTIPGTASAFQVFRNYQSSLKRSGFQELYACDRPCYDGNLGDWKDLLKARDLYLNYHRDNQYLAAQRGNTYVSLAVNNSGSGSSSETYVWLFVIDKEALDDGKMAVTGESPMAKALAAAGKVDVYGFQFDTGKAQLKIGSEATLKELAQVMTENPGLQIDVVGHTDDVGKADANLALSLARAQAVAQALTQQYAVVADRMSASGKGANQPLMPNTSEEGRAKNRRVEIIARAKLTTPAPLTPAQRRAQQNTEPPAPKEKAVTLEKTIDTVEKIRSLKGLLGF
ncbi:OmpA family protein [Ideonella sp.]|uniref:OmpA family protein n=1 Tax=Ideonella sp. TaxID=1929293 RepID=UPI003BB74AB5